MRKLIWKFRYCRALRRHVDLSWPQCWEWAESMLEITDYDLESCPLDAAYEDHMACADCCD